MNLSLLCNKADISLEDLSSITGIKLSVLKDYENKKKTPNALDLEAISKTLKISIVDLFENSIIEENLIKKSIYSRAEKKCELCEKEIPKEFEEEEYLQLFSVNNALIYEESGVVCPECHFRLKFDKTGESRKNLLSNIKLKIQSKIKWNQKDVDLELNKTIQEALLKSQDIDKRIQDIVHKMNKACIKANSESTIATRIEESLRDSLKFFNMDYQPTKEEQIKTRTDKSEDLAIVQQFKNKRIDSRFFNIITEYKKDISDGFEENKEQLKEYMENVARKENETLNKYFGILTDGLRICFISYSEDILYETPILALNGKNFKEMLKIYLSLGRKELSANGLVQDFALDSETNLTLNLAKNLYDCLLANDRNNYIRYELEWERIFKLAGYNDNNNKAIKIRKETLTQYFGGAVDETKALFCLHTAYAILIKLIAYNVMTEIFFKNKAFSLNFENLTTLPSNSLRGALLNIESGNVFKQVGIKNLLEGDFFTWYLEEEIWNEKLCTSIIECMEILSEYDPGQRLFNNNKVHDFFKILYQSIIPKEVRHSLGEYYTPDWLADHVIQTKIDEIRKNKAFWRGMDPTCGSGTFVMLLIEYMLEEMQEQNLDSNEVLQQITSRVTGYDLNPLAVLTCKINFFIAISRFIDVDTFDNLLLPIKLGDSALIPKVIQEDNNELVQSTTLVNGTAVNIILPLQLFKHENYIDNIQQFEELLFTSDTDLEQLKSLLLDLTPEKNDTINKVIERFVEQILLLSEQGMSKSWVRTIFSIFSTMVDGKYDFIVGNPPWIDWKSLPDGYRESLKVASVEQHVFSGDTFTGGINLNICALISNVVADNWLSPNGIMGLLMPKSIAFQQTYAGFRNLVQVRSGNLVFDEFIDWTKSGNPFKPVTEKFMTYYFKKTDVDNKDFVPVRSYEKKRGQDIFDSSLKSFDAMKQKFDVIKKVAYTASIKFNNFTITEESKQNLVPAMKQIAGISQYKGRVGLGLYPKEGMLLEIIEDAHNNDPSKIWVKNFKGKKSEREISTRPNQIEKKLLYPVIEGPNIVKFGIEGVKYLAPLAYKEDNVKTPIPREELRAESPNLLNYFDSIREEIKKTPYNQQVQGKKGEFYSVTRVGTYTFSPVRVAFRNNTKWVACVIENGMTPWGEEKMYLLLDHACSIGQDNEGNNISLDEAHYICAIMNSSIAETYILDSSDARSFKTDLPIRIDKYDSNNEIHVELSNLSKLAHDKSIDETTLMSQLNKFVTEYLNQ